MENYGAGSANVNPSMTGVAETGGDNANEKPEDPKGPAPRSMMSEMEQSGALVAGSRAAGQFPGSPGKSTDDTYR